MNPTLTGVPHVRHLLVITGFVLLTAFPSRAQTNRTNALRATATRLMTPSVVARPVTNSATGRATFDVKLPKDFSRYNVVEQQPRATRVATNLTATATDAIRTSLAAGSTLVFLEKEPPPPVKPTMRPEQKALFSTVLVKHAAPTRPGEAGRTASGTLTMLSDVPTPWNGLSNAFVARLSVVFLTDDTSTNNPLLPMTVEVRGANVSDIEPRRVELQRGGVDGSKEVVVTCDRYRTNVQITAYYQTTNTTRELPLQHLSSWDMTQMIISQPMLFAALTGGLMGGCLRLFKKSKWEPRRIVHYLAEGLVVGLVTVTMLLAGLLHNQIAGLPPQPQLVLAFSLAAVAGSVGAHFLDQVTARLRGRLAG